MIDQQLNLQRKNEIVKRTEEILSTEIKHHHQWDETSMELKEFQKEWSEIGSTPKNENRKLFRRMISQYTLELQ